MYRIIAIWGIFCSLMLGSCGHKKDYDYKVAFDPAWYSLEVQGRENTLTAFTTELIEAIGAEEKLTIGVYQRSWSNLMLGLQENNYQAICTPMQPYLFYEKLYVFSDIYLETGPVIVTGKNAPFDALEKLAGREVGILKGSSYALILEKYPNIIQRTYETIQPLLNDVSQGVIDAAILDILTAEAFIQDLFQGQLKISSNPLSQEGLRLVGIHGKSEALVRRFNRGLSKVKSKGIYLKIAQKWGLREDKKAVPS